MSNEDFGAVWQNTKIKTIGRIGTIGFDAANKRESVFAKNFIRNFI